jgi:hypothetical protein
MDIIWLSLSGHTVREELLGRHTRGVVAVCRSYLGQSAAGYRIAYSANQGCLPLSSDVNLFSPHSVLHVFSRLSNRRRLKDFRPIYRYGRSTSQNE